VFRIGQWSEIALGKLEFTQTKTDFSEKGLALKGLIFRTQ